MRVLFIFVDGLGIGRYDTQCNPCSSPGLKHLHHFIDRCGSPSHNGLVLGLDATLGIPGLPQSATGQTALFTGINAAELIGRHLNGFPNKTLRKVIAQDSLLGRLSRCGLKVAFINAFRPPFFDYDTLQIIRYLSVTSVANYYAGLKFYDLDDLRARRCIYQEFTNEHLRRVDFDVPRFSPTEAGNILARQAAQFDFCLYEYFQTDKAGHSLDLDRASAVLNNLEEFLDAVLCATDLATTLVIVTSDHGNIEDVCVKGHTTNPVMTLLWGSTSVDVASQLRSILDVAPALYALLT